MKKLTQRFFKALSSASYAVASVSVLSWCFFYSYQPECPEELVK
jgi:cyclic lactone autoinducer peptide